MLGSIDINCDLGEGKVLADCETDAQLMPFISSCNIACGGHAGNIEIMHKTIENALKNQLNLGAHPGYPDPENFGRVSIKMDINRLIDSIEQQITRLEEIAEKQGVTIGHIKLHGALYNDVEKNEQLACAMANFFKDRHQEKIIYALAHGKFLEQIRSRKLNAVAEGFMDRRYTSLRQLSPRGMQGAVIESIQDALSQALALAQRKTLNSLDGQPIQIEAETICLHGDNPNADQIAKSLTNTLKESGIAVAAPGAMRG